MTARIKLVFVVFSALVLAAPAMADWKDDLESSLKADIQLTKLGTSGNISSAGTVFLLKVENIQAMPTRGYMANSNIVDNGVRKEAGLAQRTFTGVLNLSTRKTAGMQIEPDSKVGIVRLRIGHKEVDVQIVTLRQQKVTLKGTDQAEYLYTWLQFPLRDLESLDAAAVKQVVYAAIVPENASVPTRATSVAAPAAARSAAANPGNSTSGGNDSLIGKTAEEMKALLGTPDSTLDVGGQTIYIYSKLGVRATVRGGRVVAAQ